MPGKSPLNPPPAEVVYHYDGSWEGLFCCIYESVYAGELPAGIQAFSEAQPSFFRCKTIETKEERALRVMRSVPKKISPRALSLARKVFLSCLAEKELAILRFLLLGYREGGGTPWMFSHPEVEPLLAAEKHLDGEVHLLKGFVRFSQHGGKLISQISPKNFVLPFLAPHFMSRFSEEDFLIYDKTHKAALVYEGGKHGIFPLEGFTPAEADENEEAFRAMWKRFYDTIAIKERENPRCRMTHMPKRYWENMLEVQDLL